jgi:hypothetical protein
MITDQPDKPIIFKSEIGDIIILPHLFMKGKKINLTWDEMTPEEITIKDTYLGNRQSQYNHFIWEKIKKGELRDPSFE